jgi:molybdopterin-guanine dinucleotide biosynthesis protein A
MLSVVIQAGGQSSRMGQDKALMSFLGKALIERVIERTAPIADQTLITTNLPAGFRYLGLELVPDEIPGRGALGGLYTALKAARQPLVAVVACDMPFVNADLLVKAQHILNNKNIDAVIPQTKHGLEPLHAVYRRATCLAAVKSAIDADQWRMIAWHAQVHIHKISMQEIQQFDPQGLAFWNVNTPEEFKRAERIARQEKEA